MLSPARIVIVDDEREQIAPLVEALHCSGISCLGIRYDPASAPNPNFFAGVRVLFCDLHLLAATAGTVPQYDAIASLLDSCIPNDHGPYVVALWTSHPQERDDLLARLNELVKAEALPVQKLPLMVLALDKNLYLAPGGNKIPDLMNAITTEVQKVPQLRALLGWEQDVVAAANAVLGLLGTLVPDDHKTPQLFPAALDRVLSKLAEEGAGRTNALSDPRGAINSALAPLLTDRILHQGTDDSLAEVWQDAVTFQEPGLQLTAAQAASVNRMLHLAVPPMETIAADSWGAVVPISDADLADERMMQSFGLTRTEILQQEFRVPDNQHENARLFLVRTGAKCDHAQCRAGPIPYTLGMVLAASVRPGKCSDAVWTSPKAWDLANGQPVVKLYVHARFAVSRVQAELNDWPDPIFRLREPVLLMILAHASKHLVRPGILSV